MMIPKKKGGETPGNHFPLDFTGKGKSGGFGRGGARGPQKRVGGPPGERRHPVPGGAPRGGKRGRKGRGGGGAGGEKRGVFGGL